MLEGTILFTIENPFCCFCLTTWYILLLRLNVKDITIYLKLTHTKPIHYYAADYCAYPVSCMVDEKVSDLPTQLPIGLSFKK